MIWINYPIISLSALLLILFIIFCIYFIIQTKNLNNELKLKNQYNEYANCFFYDNMQYIKTLSENNEKLKKLVDNIIYERQFYREQLKNIKSNIENLTYSNSFFCFKHSKRNIANIVENLKKCKKLYDRISQSYNVTIDYNDSCSNLITLFRKNYNLINSFYKKHLSNKFNHNQFNILSQEISNLILQSNNYSIKINNNEIIKIINMLNEKTKFFHSLIKSVYTYELSWLYFQRTNKDLNEQFKNNKYSLSRNEYSNIEKIIANTKININDYDCALMQLNFKECDKLLINISNEIEPTINIFRQNDKINNTIDKCFSFTNNWLRIWKDKNKILSPIFINLMQYFRNDNEIKKEILEIKNKFETIVQNHDIIHTAKDEPNYFSRIKILNNLLVLIDQYKIWESRLIKFKNNIWNKYFLTIQLINDIYELQFAFNQFIIIKKELNPFDINSIQNLNENLSALNHLISLMQSNFETNYKEVYDAVTEMKNDENNYYELIKKDIVIKFYAQKLIFYTNRYRNENKEIENALSNAESLYNNKKFDEVIDEILPILENIKISAKLNHIKIQ